MIPKLLALTYAPLRALRNVTIAFILMGMPAGAEPVTLVATFPLVFVAPANTTQSLQELIEVARAKPGTVSYGSIGSGSPASRP